MVNVFVISSYFVLLFYNYYTLSSWATHFRVRSVSAVKILDEIEPVALMAHFSKLYNDLVSRFITNRLC